MGDDVFEEQELCIWMKVYEIFRKKRRMRIAYKSIEKGWILTRNDLAYNPNIIMSSSSSSSHATVTYTSVSSDDDLPSWGISLMDAYEPEYLAPSDDNIAPTEDQSLPASASPTTLTLDYSVDSEPVEEDPEEDLEDDPEEEQSEEEEEELSVLTNSPPAGLYIDLPSEVEEDETPLPLYINALIEEWRTAPTSLSPSPSPSPLSPLSYLLPRIPSPLLLLPSPTRRDIIPEANMPPRKRARFAALS
ncbi:hypothetical protein Tco_1125184 [Tanacetum coccineum]|uniref:Uncharacterized protein n=1 Tax=Tanacetum coccineum TaxID=301880 RepID=A0ABQ5J8A9_9ASTR